MNKSHIGYITSRPINGGIVPHRVQNIIINHYAENNNIDVNLSATEYNLGNSLSILKNILSQTEINGILFYSIKMLPEDIHILEQIFSFVSEGLELHFCAENLYLNSKNLEDFKIDFLYARVVDKNKADYYSYKLKNPQI